MNTILTHYVPFKSIVLRCFFLVATLDEILLCFLKKARSRQSYCASHVARTFISAFHRPCFTAPCLYRVIRTSRQPIRKLYLGYGPGHTDPKKISSFIVQNSPLYINNKALLRNKYNTK